MVCRGIVLPVKLPAYCSPSDHLISKFFLGTMPQISGILYCLLSKFPCLCFCPQTCCTPVLIMGQTNAVGTRHVQWYLSLPIMQKRSDSKIRQSPTVPRQSNPCACKVTTIHRAKILCNLSFRLLCKNGTKLKGGANPKHAGICHLGMGKNGEKWGKMGQIKNFEIHV